MKTKLRIVIATALVFGGMILAAPGLLVTWLGLLLVNGTPTK